jgi:hypothetical protein
MFSRRGFTVLVAACARLSEAAMRAMAEGRGDGPVEPGLSGISKWFHSGIEIDDGLLKVVKLDAEVLASVQVLQERSIGLVGPFWIFLSQINKI